MKLLLFLLRISRGIVAFAVLIGIVAGASSAGLIATINTRLGNSDLSSSGIAWFFALLVAMVLAANVTSQLVSTRLSQRTIFDLRMRLSRQVLAAPLRQLEEIGAHRILATLTEDVPVVASAILSIPSLCINAATLVVCLIYLGWLSKSLLVGMLVFVILGAVIYQLMVMKALTWIRLARKEQNDLMGHYRALTDGAKELRLHKDRRKAFLAQVLEPTALSFRRHVIIGNALYTAGGVWSTLMFYVFIGLLLFMLPGVEQVSRETLTGYTLTVLYVLGPLAGILGTLPALGRARVSLQQVESLGLSLTGAGVERETDSSPRPSAAWRRLQLTNVTHSYHREAEDNSFLLGPIDMTFRPGEAVFLVGGNGSGKTTLAKLLTGLYEPETGEIRLDGQLITDENRERYRQHFSAIFSDFYLFESLLGLVSPDLDAQARAYLIKLQLDHKVEVRDGLLSTTELSYGQRKRLALLTAYLEDRPFYVFDEWAAGQDPFFKEIFYTQLIPELKGRGKAVLIISHDEKYFHIADRIIKLDSGKLDSTAKTETQSSILCEVSNF